MSSLPSEEGILSLRMTLDLMAKLRAEADVLNAEVASRKLRLEQINEQYADAHRRVPTILASMDIASNGNYGWERRLEWALTELASQYMPEAPNQSKPLIQISNWNGKT